MRGMAELLKNDSRAAVEAVGHALGAWTPSARVRGYQEASCAHCGHKVVTGPRGMVGQLPPCRRGAHRPDTRTIDDPAVQAAVERERLAMQAALDIGDPVDLAELNAILKRPRDATGLVVPGVTDVDLTSPTGDTVVASTAVAQLDFTGLTWATV